jgi:small-conductance mechanosensitive channel
MLERLKKVLLNLLLPVSLFVAVVVVLSGEMDHVLIYLDSPKFTLSVGDFKISLYSLVKAIFAILVLFSAANLVSNFLEIRIRKFRKLTFTTRQLLVKSMHILVYLVTFLTILKIIGIDLKAFAILGGGIGIGIGIGLQKISSNFISGIILLFEKNLQRDDLVEIDDKTVGFIRKMRGRYVLLETLDNKEVMIPNEDLITQRVTNCTLSNKIGRISVDVGVSYASDMRKVHNLIIEAALESEFCLKDPNPRCCMVEFGNSSVNFTLYFWMVDVATGVVFAKSEIMFKIWDKFKENNIEIPFPQRDINFKNALRIEGLKNS